MTQTQRVILAVGVFVVLLVCAIGGGSWYWHTRTSPAVTPAVQPVTNTKPAVNSTPIQTTTTIKTYIKGAGDTGTGTLRISNSSDGRYTVRLVAGGAPEGAATAGDCEIRAEGSLNNGVITATFTPFEGDLMSYTAANAVKKKRIITIALGLDTAEVTRADVTDYCADGVTPEGLYLVQK